MRTLVPENFMSVCHELYEVDGLTHTQQLWLLKYDKNIMKITVLRTKG